VIKQFSAVAEGRARGGIAVKLTFEPADEWGERDRYDITGTIDGYKVRGKLISRSDGHYLELGPAWCRDNAVLPGSQVVVALAPEGPQVSALDDDIAAALTAEPAARSFFESLPTFYRKNFMRSIQDAKQPATRARRIAEMVALLKAGKRERQR
jgi:hypothetical protein